MMASSNKHNTLACPSRMSLIHFWKCSGELVILKEGILLGYDQILLKIQGMFLQQYKLNLKY